MLKLIKWMIGCKIKDYFLGFDVLCQLLIRFFRRLILNLQIQIMEVGLSTHFIYFQVKKKLKTFPSFTKTYLKTFGWIIAEVWLKNICVRFYILSNVTSSFDSEKMFFFFSFLGVFALFSSWSVFFKVNWSLNKKIYLKFCSLKIDFKTYNSLLSTFFQTWLVLLTI